MLLYWNHIPYQTPTWLKKICNKYIYIYTSKKAFDAVDHEIVLHTLKCYGIRGLINDFFRSYLTNRRQYTVLNGVSSDLCIMWCATRFCVTTIVFLLYINDLYRSIGHSAVISYADDTAAISSDSSLDIAQRQSRERFTKLYHWCLANTLSINNDTCTRSNANH